MDSPKSSSSSAETVEPVAAPEPEMPKEVPEDLKVLRVAIRMLMDYAKVMTDGTRGYEIGCRCKNEFVAKALEKVITACVGDLPSIVTRQGDNVVVIRDTV